MGKNGSGPLVGMRVLELSHVMAGPTCGRMLADMGADVIKVEKPDGGDDTRRMVPPEINGESAAYMMMNRNKRGIALDLKQERGRDILRRLVADADVLIENFRHDTMAKLGLGYEQLREINPGLIYTEISGYGRSGPYAHHGGFDLIAQGVSGLMSITGEGPGRPPVKVGAPVADITAGIIGAMGVVAAYVHKLKTGEGQRVDTSLFEAAFTHTYWQSAICMATGISPDAMGSAHPLSAPYQAFRTADGWINIGGANQNNWLRTLDVLGAGALAKDPRFATNRDRMLNLADLQAELAPWFKVRSTADWLAAFEAAGVPAGPVLSIAEAHVHPQALAREMVCNVEHPSVGTVATIGFPVKFSQSPGAVCHAAPRLGEDGREILQELGMSVADIEVLIADGVLAVPR